MIFLVKTSADGTQLFSSVREATDGTQPGEGETSMTAAEYRAAVAAFYASQVPASVRSAQLRQWLIDAELLASVDAILDNAEAWPDAKAQAKAKARWRYEVNVRRDDAMVVSLGAALGLTPEQIDAAFIAASQIP